MSPSTGYPYEYAQVNLAALSDEVVSTREPIVIHRLASEDVALVAADELRSLMETAHLLRSPRNVQRLLTALVRAQDQELAEETVEELQWEFEFG